jgi:hypothetical protein
MRYWLMVLLAVAAVFAINRAPPSEFEIFCELVANDYATYATNDGTTQGDTYYAIIAASSAIPSAAPATRHDNGEILFGRTTTHYLYPYVAEHEYGEEFGKPADL